MGGIGRKTTDKVTVAFHERVWDRLSGELHRNDALACLVSNRGRR